MSIPQNKYMDRYLEEATIYDLMKKYTLQGFSVSRDVTINNIQCDLLLENTGKRVYIEVVVRETEDKEAQQNKIVQLHKAVKDIPGAEFRVVFANRPKEVSVEIDDIENILFESMVNDIPEDLNSLGGYLQIEEVSDVEIDGIQIRANKIRVFGSLIVSVHIQSGSDRDLARGDGFELNDSFSGTFDATLNRDLSVDEVEFDIDVSSWYE